MEYIRKQSLLADLNETTPHSYFAFETMVRAYPTEDVAPVRHACWIESFEDDRIFLMCPCCASVFGIDKTKKIMYGYCPHCGAKMDEEDGKQ